MSAASAAELAAEAEQLRVELRAAVAAELERFASSPISPASARRWELLEAETAACDRLAAEPRPAWLGAIVALELELQALEVGT